MADDNRNNTQENNSSVNPNTRNINQLLDYLGKQTDDLFRASYSSDQYTQKMLDKVTDDISDSIQDLINGDDNYNNLSNMSKLYERLAKNNNAITDLFAAKSKNGVTGTNNIMDMFTDNRMLASLMDTYADTKWIKELDQEYDMVLKYMPKLKTALDIKRDNVLCADTFSKQYLNASIRNQSEDAKLKFQANFEALKKEYNLEECTERWYDDTSKYGEVFVYCVPYSRALAQLMSRKGTTGYTLREACFPGDKSRNISGKDLFKNVSVTGKVINEDGRCAITLSLNRTGILEDAVENVKKAHDILSQDICESVYDKFIQEATGDAKKTTVALDTMFKKGDTLEYEDDTVRGHNTSNDGLISADGSASALEKKIKVPGCVLSTLDRDHVIPLYLDNDYCLGYYYIKFTLSNLGDINSTAMNNGYNSITSMFTGNSDNSKEIQGDNALRMISAEIARHIDSNFINANQDLRKEIYMMLKYNDTFNQNANLADINVTFIPPEDIIHWRFNIDHKTHRGISDLWMSMIPAKMWIMLTTTTTVGQVTRGQDKRVYYVKSMVETNVAKTLLNVVAQIKKGNFGMRQMESINNILGIVGKFNDFVIPVGPSGDRPVEFDIMQGQQFELPSDLTQNLEESAVNQTGIPIEIVNSSYQSDFAIRYTMTNAKLLMDVIHRQAIVDRLLGQVCTKLYNCEYNENIDITITLPAPSSLMMTQGSALLQTAQQYIESLATIELGQNADQTDKDLFEREMLHEMLPTYIDIDMVNRVLDRVKIEKAKIAQNNNNQEGQQY